MKFLFLDDSKQKVKNKFWEYVGYGGFCIDSKNIQKMEFDFYHIRKQYKIPQHIELKWSPNKLHFLNKEFCGNRTDLFKEIISLLGKYNSKVLCAVHDINECKIVSEKKWSMEQAYLWAANEQLKFLISRYCNPYLEKKNDIGLIIADHYGDKKGENDLIFQSKKYINEGKIFKKFNRICLPPLTVSSKDLPFIQLADLIIGITVGALVKNRYAEKLFHKFKRLFLNKSLDNSGYPHDLNPELIFDYGLKLFPNHFKKRIGNIFK